MNTLSSFSRPRYFTYVIDFKQFLRITQSPLLDIANGMRIATGAVALGAPKVSLHSVFG